MAPIDSYSPTPGRALVQWVLLAVGLGILGLMMTVNMALEYRYTDTREQDRLSIQAKAVAQNISLQLASGNRALEAVLGSVSGFDVTAQTPLLKSMVSAMPGIRAIGIMDEQGNLLASSNTGIVGMNFGSRSYFLAAKHKPDADILYVSTPFQSVSGIYSINLSRAVLGRDGKFRGLVSATLANQYFETLMQSVLYAPDMWAAAVHSDGPLFLRQPADKGIFGIDLSQGDTLFNRHRLSTQQATIQYGLARGQTQDQTAALYTVSIPNLHMDKSLVVAVGRDTDAIFATWRHRAMVQGALFVLIALMSMMGLGMYRRRQRLFDDRSEAARQALRAKDKDYRLIVEGTNDMVFKLDAQGVFTYANPAFCSLFGLSQGEVVGLRCEDQPTLAGQCMEERVWRELLDPPYTVRYQKSSTTVNGPSDIDWCVQALRDDAGVITGIVGIGHDITEHIALTMTLQEQAQRDPLTGLANRRYFLEKARVEQARADRHEHPLSALMLDLDHFKRINDTYGHKMGDTVLQRLAELLRATKREPDIVARWGGEEFVVLLPDTDLTQAVQVAERMRCVIADSVVQTDAGEDIRFAASVGAAQLGESAATLELMLEQADQALYLAKHTGRNRVCVLPAR